MNYYLIIYCVTIVSMLILHFLLMKKIIKKLEEFKKHKEETDRKLEILIKVSHMHDQFIEAVKKRAEEAQVRNRKVVR